MDLEKKIVRIDQIKCQASTQLALEDDRNLQDRKPDMTEILCKKGSVSVEEIKIITDHVLLKGKLLYDILYRSDEIESVCSIEGFIPFEEQVFMENVESEDLVQTRWELEDLSVDMINSRKLSIQALVEFGLFVEILCDQEFPVATADETGMGQLECKKKSLDVTEIKVQKKDIFRIRESMELPQNLPNIQTIIWQDVSVPELEFKTVDERIFMKGEVRIFVLYEGEGTEGKKIFATSIPINGALDCQGCKNTLLPDIRYQMKELQLDVQDDFDGEARILSMEMVLDLYIKLYEELKMEIVSDCYGIHKNADILYQKVQYKSALHRSIGKCKVQELIKDTTIPEDCMVVHTQTSVQKESKQVTDKGMDILGAIFADVLLTDTSGKFYQLKCSMPFHYLLETPIIPAENTWFVEQKVEHLGVSRTGEGWEIKGTVCFSLAAFRIKEENVIREVTLSPIDSEMKKREPGMIGYIVKSGDTLWDVGKRYMVSLDSIRQTNNLSNELHNGDKILIIR